MSKHIPLKERLEKNSILNKETGCIEWTGFTQGGCGQLTIETESGMRVNKRAHRVAYEEYIGEIPKGLCVCHCCDNQICINPDHLFLRTAQDVANNTIAKGRSARGERAPSVKLTTEQVILIRESCRAGVTQKSIATTYGVNPSAISKIINGRTWQHIKEG